MSSKIRQLDPLRWEQELPELLLARIKDTGIIGMGGAGFSTYQKIAVAREHRANVVIANGIETDPDVAADQVLLKTRLNDVLKGLRIVAKILSAARSYLAVSDKDIAQQTLPLVKSGETVTYLTATYQNGAERELIETLTGNAVKEGCIPAHFGYVVLNVHTLWAIAQAIAGIPLTKRLITVNNSTRWVEIGARIDSITEANEPIRVGSYATGRRPQKNEVISATVNAISIDQSVHAQPCIKCGWCDAACPRGVPVESLYWAAHRQKPTLSAQTALDGCNDCGACVVACPSRLHLLDYIRELRRRNAEELERLAHTLETKRRVEARRQRLRLEAIDADTTRTERMKQKHKW